MLHHPWPGPVIFLTQPGLYSLVLWLLCNSLALLYPCAKTPTLVRPDLFAPAWRHKSVAGESTCNCPDRFCFTSQSTNRWSTSALPRDPTTVASHSATSQDGYLYQLRFSIAPMPFSWLVLSWWSHLPFTEKKRPTECSLPTTKLTNFQCQFVYALPSLLLQIINHPCACIVLRPPLRPWVPFFLIYSRTDCNYLHSCESPVSPSLLAYSFQHRDMLWYFSS